MGQTEEINTPLATIKLSKALEILNKVASTLDSDPDLTFEFFMASFYPTVFDNIKDALAKEHTLGYMEGLNENKTK